jgi:CDP-diglyceride synthetase
MNTTNEDKILGYTAASEHRTNHVLHLILTLVTAGVWSWVWLIVASSNISKRNKIKKKFGLPTESNIPKVLLWINAIFWIFIVFALMSASKSQAASTISTLPMLEATALTEAFSLK